LKWSTLCLVCALAVSALLVNVWYKPFSSVQNRGIARGLLEDVYPLQFQVADLLQHALVQDGQRWPRPVYESAVEAITAVVQRHHFHPALVLSLIHHESRFDLQAVSSAGALGLTQLLPSTAAFVARSEGMPPPSRADLFDPATNIRLGFALLAELERHYGSRDTALTVYNGGPEVLLAAEGSVLPLAGYRAAIHQGERIYGRWLKSPDRISQDADASP
jgi:soluble lytic murein transglycosylase-like protein